MEPFLSPIPQFIVASVNFLITTTQAQYLNRLNERIYYKKISVSLSVKLQWWFLLLGWWILTASSVLVIGRIVAFAFKYVDQWGWFFGWFDLLIVIFMGLGYVCLMVVACLAWPWLPKPAEEGRPKLGT